MIRVNLGAGRRLVFWGALLILFANDRWLKRASLLPSAVTGKLSDFAGLVVVGLGLAMVFCSSARQRAWALLLVGSVFTLIKTVPDTTRHAERLLGLLGIPSRIWCDPTDLCALLVLPVIWVLDAPRPQLRECTRVGPAVRAWDGLGLLLGACACMASGYVNRDIRSSVYLVNVTRETRQVQLYRLTTPLDCPNLTTNPVDSFTAEQFVFERCDDLGGFDILPLDRDWYREPDADLPATPPEPLCDAVTLRARGLPDTLVFWNDVPKNGLKQPGRHLLSRDASTCPSGLPYCI